MNWCLLPSQAQEFRKKIRDGTIDPVRMAKMSSGERRAFLGKIVGEENAKEINAAFESKLLLKNQQKGIANWARSVAGLKPEVKRDLFTRIQKMEQVLDPKAQDQFLEDLAAQRLGLDVSAEEAKTIAALSRKVAQTKDALDAGGDRLEYGRAKVALASYVTNLKAEASRTPLLKQLTHPVDAISTVAGNAKSIKASLDLSAIFRQGFKTMFTSPSIWAKNSVNSVTAAVKTLGGKAVIDELNADLLSRPNADRYQKAKLAIGTVEEAYPETLAERIPVLGRVFKASDVAYTAFTHRTRADVFDKYIQIAKRSGVNIDDRTQLEAIGRLVNSLTGRGNLGKAEPAAKVINNVFFSPRALKANIDTLTAHAFDAPTSFVRKQAALNLIKILIGMGSVLAIAKFLKDDAVELDPRSSDFGKIRVGDTRFDVSGGMAALAVLASRLATQSSKSSTTGKVAKLNSGGFGAATSKDVVYNFFENKFSPAAGVVRDMLEGQDFSGNPVTIQGELANLLAPLPITNATETAQNPRSAPILLAMLADALGISTNTYSANAKWQPTQSAELKSFYDKVGADQFKAANQSFNDRYNAWLGNRLTDPQYQALTDEQKQALLLKKQDQVKAQIFKDYGFSYKKKPAVKVNKDLLK